MCIIRGLSKLKGAVIRNFLKQIWPWCRAAKAEPYRVFFLCGVFWGMAGIGHWLFYALHWSPVYSMQLHSAIQMNAYMGCFIVGFLLTALPRFASAPQTNTQEFFGFFILVNAGPVFYLRHEWIPARLCFAAWIVLLIIFFARRFWGRSRSNSHPPVEFVWIPAALMNGLLGVILMVGADRHFFSNSAAKTGKLLSEQGFLLSVVLGMGSFLGPRLMGTFQPSFQVIKDRESQKRERGNALCFQGVAALGLAVTFGLEGAGYAAAAFSLRALIVGWIYFRSKTLVLRPLIKDPFVRLIWISFWMVFIGHAGLVLFPAYRSALLHIIFLGGYAMMTFGVGIMVVFSHGGQSGLLQKRTWQIPVLALILMTALILRVSAVFSPDYFFIIVGASAAFWFFAASLWLCLVLKPVFKLLPAEEFDRRHEEAKQRVAELRSKA